MCTLWGHWLCRVACCACGVVERARGDRVGLFDSPSEIIEEVDGGERPEGL